MPFPKPSKGAHFGEIAVFGDGIRTAGATTKGISEIYHLVKRDIVSVLNHFPKLKLTTYKKAHSHLKEDLERIEEAELGLSLGPIMSEEQRKVQKARVTRAVAELEIEIEAIKEQIKEEEEIMGESPSGTKVPMRRKSSSFIDPMEEQRRILSTQREMRVASTSSRKGGLTRVNSVANMGRASTSATVVLTYKDDSDLLVFSLLLIPICTLAKPEQSRNGN